MLPVSNRTERVATLFAIAVGWLLILAYLVMVLGNLVGVLRDGASGNLLARIFSFGGRGVDQPWLEAYALAKVLALIIIFSLSLDRPNAAVVLSRNEGLIIPRGTGQRT